MHTNKVKVSGILILSFVVFTVICMYLAASKGRIATDRYAPRALAEQLTPQPGAHPTAQPRMLSLGGYHLLCHERYGDAFRNILVVMQLFSGPITQRSKDSAAMYDCFFPNLKRYKYCDNVTIDTESGYTCMRLSETLASDNWTDHGMPGYAPRASTHIQYEFMADAMMRWPDYEGYIFLQDDVVMNFWNFPARHDFKKVWRGLDFPDPDIHVWKMHMNMSLTSGEKHCNVCGVWTKGSQLVQINKLVNELSDDQKKRLFNANSDTGLPTFRMANSDFYYVPKSVVSTFLPLILKARKHMVFHELALPIIFDGILERDQYEITPAAALSILLEKRMLVKFSLYNPCWDYFHKMKPSHDQQFHWMVETVFRYGPMTGRWDCGETGMRGIGPEAFEIIGCGYGCPKSFW